MLTATDSHVLDELRSIFDQPHFDHFLVHYLLVLFTIGQGAQSMRAFARLELIDFKNGHFFGFLATML